MHMKLETSSIESTVSNQNTYFSEGETLSIQFRKEKLRILSTALSAYEKSILSALKTDLNKSPFEAYATEIALVQEEIRYFLKHLSHLSRPKRVPSPLAHFWSTSKIYNQPYGTVLVMSPWNYPFQLTFVPLIGALAAGNTAVVKPSRYAPATADVIAEIVQYCFSPDYVSVIKGGREVNTELLRQKFDYIFFTGSVTVGTIVMEAAAKHLTPVSLELGGKSPCIVDNTAKIDLAAKRIIWGKLLNAGQTCVAPDYILAHESIVPQLLDAMQKYITEFFGVHPEKNPDYPKIISQRHFERLSNLIDSSQIHCGGQLNDQTLQIAPAIVYPVSTEDTVMDDEIFGPILPVLEYRNLEEPIAFINSRPKPLALYHFTESKKNQKAITRSISFGGGCINDTVVHIASSHMPFGGVGASGMGSYHGKASFETFSHRKAILKKSTRTDVPFRYAPYNKGLRLLKRLMG